MRLEGLDKLKKCNDFTGNQIRDLLTCRIVPQQGLSQLIMPVTLSGIESAAFRLVAQFLNQLLYRLPQFRDVCTCY
jgi:hypothetical protein